MARKTQGFRVIRWIETHCVYTQGRWIGKPVRLLDWEKRLILDMFAVGDNGLRQYRWAYVSVGKKNGKTELAAWLALYLLIGDDEPSPLIAVAAAAEKQADLVFGAAKRCAEMSPTLRHIVQPYAGELQVPSIPGAVLRRIAATEGTNDGPSYSAVFCDELHEWAGVKGKAVWDILTNATGARLQPLVFQITTAGFDVETVCYEQYSYAKQVERGEIADPRYFSYIMEADEDDDHLDPKVWEKVNPSFGVTVMADFYDDQLTKKTEAVFRRYFCNQWTATEEIVISRTVWRGLRSDAALDSKRPSYVAVDFALGRQDSCAVAVAQWNGSRIVLRCRIWSNPYPMGDPRRERFVMPIAEIENHIRDLRKTYPEPAKMDDKGHPVPGPLVAYDPARFEQSAQSLTLDDVNMVEYHQTDTRMVPPAETFLELCLTSVIAHDGDATLASHINNIARVDRPRGGWRFGKAQGRPNDGALAASIAVYEANMARAESVERTVDVSDLERFLTPAAGPEKPGVVDARS